MYWVVDASFAAALFLPDETSSGARRFFAGLKPADVLWVPSLWWHEITNVLIIAERRKRLTPADVTKIFTLLAQFNIETDILCGTRYSGRIYEIAKTCHLTAYDAAYLELAMRKDATLATLDKQLVKASNLSGVNLFS
jgi:predicted nucleic acid-binding protein